MFVFSTCQIGAEADLKRELTQMSPGVRSAFARPGFVSFKAEQPLPEDLISRSVFARTVSTSLGKVIEPPNEIGADKIWQVVSEHPLFINRVHVFQRDPLPVGMHDFEPHIPPELAEIHRRIVEQSPAPKFLGTSADDIFQPAKPGETVLDVVRIEPNLYFVGTHSVKETSPIHARYSGGILPMTLPADVISRAYLKFCEGVHWAGMTLGGEDSWLDIGASPGGCSQFLVQQGVKVIGIDPGAIHPAVLNHPRFTHIRRRIKDVKRSLFREIRWIAADMNVAPNYTLDVLEEIITQAPSVQGLLFTLKLIRREFAGKLPMWLDRIRTWGFPGVRAKQLTFNRQEIMVALTNNATTQ